MGNIPFNPDKGYALVVGVGQRAADNDAMDITALDAKRVADELIGRVRFQEKKVSSLVGEAATKTNLLDELDKLATATEHNAAEMVIIYFSGHGCVINNTYYIVCHDTVNEDLPGTAIEGNLFVNKLQAIKTDKMLILLDCCHSGGIYNAAAPPVPDCKAADVPFVPDIIFEKRNRAIISASAAADVSFATKPLSVFTYALVEGLAGKFFSPGSADVDQDKEVTLFNLAMYLRERVSPLTENKQRPQLNVVQNATTSDFQIAYYAKGQPKPPLFDDEFKLTSDGKEVNTGLAPVRDEKYRTQFTWITGNNNTINQYANSITNNIYGALDLHRPFNVYLTLMLMEALKKSGNDDAIGFLDEHPDKWYLNFQARGAAQEILIASYVNVIGIKLRGLMSIGTESTGTETFTASIGLRYVQQCLNTANTTFQLMDFAILSDLWDRRRGTDLTLSTGQIELIRPFFEYSKKFDGGLNLYIKLFRDLLGIYKDKGIDLPFAELKDLGGSLDAGSDFYRACDELDRIQKVEDDDQKYSYANCLKTEKNLAEVMSVLGFLSNYKMASIKSVNYEENRNADPNYLHNFVDIRSGNTANASSTGIKYVANPVTTDSILLYTGSYINGITKGINLFPFILDYNALILDGGIKIGLFCSSYKTKITNEDDDGKTYKETIRFIYSEDDHDQDIFFENILGGAKNINEFLKNKESRKQVKLDSVFLQFHDAKKTILGEE
jgi:hypothetical protein